MRRRVWIAVAVGVATALLLHLGKGFFLWHAAVVGLAVALLAWSVGQTAERLRNLYRR